MQRPVMSPTFLDDAPSPKQRLRILRVLWRLMCRMLRLVVRVLTYDPLHRKLRIEEGSLIGQCVRGLAYRAAFVPVIIVAMVCLIVWQATHPKLEATGGEPEVAALYFEPVTFVTSDNVRLEGSLYPVLDARQVLEEKDKVLRKRYPAVVLVHDFGMRRDQMLPLVRPLHDAGFVVLAMDLRGTGASGAAAHTFGLREALDVKAAVEMLRRRPFIDARRIVVVGAGTGATAALTNARTDPAISALVVADPLKNVDDLVESRLAPRHPSLQWLRPLCKGTFELGYQLDIDEMEWKEFDRVFETRPVLVLGSEGGQTDFSRPRNIEMIRSFLVKQILEPEIPVVKAGE